MNGGWDDRRSDLIKYIRTSTNVLQSENDQLLHMLRLGAGIQQHLLGLEARAAELRRDGGGNPDLPEADVQGFATKLADCRDVLANMASSHQYFFNPHVEEFMHRHRTDFKAYEGFEQQFLDVEKRRREQGQGHAQWLIQQCERNILEIKQATEDVSHMEQMHFQRNKTVMKNEAKLLRAMTNIHKSCETADAFLNRYYVARGELRPDVL